MKKLTIKKIKLAELSLESQRQIKGGDTSPQSVTITITTTVTARTMNTWPGCFTENCLTKKPGTQDSCGLCTTNYACY